VIHAVRTYVVSVGSFVGEVWREALEVSLVKFGGSVGGLMAKFEGRSVLAIIKI
jgi:hypothetical protein